MWVVSQRTKNENVKIGLSNSYLFFALTTAPLLVAVAAAVAASDDDDDDEFDLTCINAPAFAMCSSGVNKLGIVNA